MFLFLLPTKYEKHFLTEQRENELLTPQKPAPHVVQEKLAVVSSLIESPTTRQSLQQCGYVNSPENEELQIASSTLQQDATAAVQATKRKRSTDARTATQVSLSFIQSFRREVLIGGVYCSSVYTKTGVVLSWDQSLVLYCREFFVSILLAQKRIWMGT